MNTLITIGTYLGILGVPSIFTIFIFVFRRFDTYTKQLVILMRAQKAQMRAQLLKDYYNYERQGWISDIEMQEWQNQYQAYHELVGPNGV